MDERVAKSLTRFKVMAFVVGSALMVLIAVMVLKYGFEQPEWSERWSPIHGVLYMVYLVTVADLGQRLRWPVPRMIGVALAGAVPFLSFVVERRVEQGVRERHGAADTLAG